MKKILISILITAFLNLIGCYSVSEVSKDEFIGAKNSDAYLLTNHLEKLHFKNGNYFVEKDTLQGIGERQFGGVSFPFKGSVPLDSVNNYQIEYLDGLKTTELVLGIGALVVLIAGVIIAGDIFSGIFSLAH